MYYDMFRSKLSKALNVTSLTLGLLSSFGVSIVANFQQGNVAVVHFLGASMAFFLGSIYFITQVKFLTYFMCFFQLVVINVSRRFTLYYSYKTKWAEYVWFPDSQFALEYCWRLWCYYVFSLTSYADRKQDMCSMVKYLYTSKFQKKILKKLFRIPGESKLQWTSKHSGYSLHLAAAFSEWTLVASVLLYLATFVGEFKFLKFNGIPLISCYVWIKLTRFYGRRSNSYVLLKRKNCREFFDIKSRFFILKFINGFRIHLAKRLMRWRC